MRRLIFALPLLLLLGCGDRNERGGSDEGTPIDTYRKGIDRSREVQQKASERAKNLDSLSQGDQ
jgi:hypothetical protein